MRLYALLIATMCIGPVWGTVSADGQADANAEAETQQSNEPKQEIMLLSLEQQFSYALGMEIVSLYGKAPETITIDPDLVARGIRDAMNQTPALSDAQAMTIATEADYRIQAVIGKKNAEFTERNAAFMDENRDRPGVYVTPSGLQYIVLAEGDGRQPTLDDMVQVHYTAKLIDDAEFDSSYSRGEPGVFAVAGVIEGWKEALPMMKEGAKWQLFIPPDMAYGKEGNGAQIPPNAVLVFELELISVQ